MLIIIYEFKIKHIYQWNAFSTLKRFILFYIKNYKNPIKNFSSQKNQVNNFKIAVTKKIQSKRQHVDLCILVNDTVISSIGQGLCVLIGISRDDTDKDIEFM